MPSPFGSLSKFKSKFSDSLPKKVLIYNEYDVVYFYDHGYSLIIALSLAHKGNDLRLRSFFAKADSLSGKFFLDTNGRNLVAQANSSVNTLFRSTMNGSLTTEFSMPNGANVIALDRTRQIAYFCKDNFIGAIRMSDKRQMNSNGKLPCGDLSIDDGIGFYRNHLTPQIQKVSFEIDSGTAVSNSSYRPLPLRLTSASRIISFKSYKFKNGDQTNRCDRSKVPCDSQICLPTQGDGVCSCMDYYIRKDGNNVPPNNPCVKETLHGDGIFYAIFNVSYAQRATLFYRLEGRPEVWGRRPQREQLFTISSDISGVSYDWLNQRIYAAASRYRQIMSASVDGKFQTSTHYMGLTPNVKSVLYDYVGNNLVFFDPVYRIIRYVSLNGSAYDDIIKTYEMRGGNVFGYDMKVDPINGYLFFLEYDPHSDGIVLIKTNMDGTDFKQIFTFPPDVARNLFADFHAHADLPGGMSINVNKRQ